jgi:hypothetical protein
MFAEMFMAKREQVSVPLSREQAEFVKQQAEREERSAASVIRRLVERARVAGEPHGESLPNHEQRQQSAAA